MKLKNIERIFSEAIGNNQKRLLFDFNFGKLCFKCLILIENKVLMISNLSHSIGHSVVFDENNEFSTYVPKDFYSSIVNELKEMFNDNKINIMWAKFDEYLSDFDISKYSEGSKSDVNKILITMKTKDNDYDIDGDKPYFKKWIRHIVNEVSPKNIKKTARYFGKKIALFCEKENISTGWSNKIQKKSFDFFDINSVENELNDLIKEQTAHNKR